MRNQLRVSSLYVLCLMVSSHLCLMRSFLYRLYDIFARWQQLLSHYSGGCPCIAQSTGCMWILFRLCADHSLLCDACTECTCVHLRVSSFDSIQPLMSCSCGGMMLMDAREYALCLRGLMMLISLARQRVRAFQISRPLCSHGIRVYVCFCSDGRQDCLTTTLCEQCCGAGDSGWSCVGASHK